MSGEIGEVCNIFKTCKIPSFIADRDAPIGKSLPETVKKAINNSELVLVFLTKNSKKSIWVNQEIGYALGKGIPIIPLRKGRIRLKGLIESTKYVSMKSNAIEIVKDIFNRLKDNQLSPIAQATIFTFIGALELREKYAERGNKK